MHTPGQQILAKWPSIYPLNLRHSPNLTKNNIRPHKIQCALVNSNKGSRCDDVHADIVVVGGGIIGLCAAYSFLKHRSTKLTVALIETNDTIPGPSIGNGSATGAGQGYIWMAHRQPESPAWLLAEQSKALWRELFQTDDAVPESSVAWQPSGSILLATSLAETEQLRKRQAMLGAAGIKAALMDEGQLRAEEPALGDAVCAGLVTRTDAQLNGRLAASALLRACEVHSGGSNFTLLLQHRVESFELCQSTGRATAVQTEKRRVIPSKALIIAAGAWTADLVAQAAPASSAAWLPSIKPRRGHLLELPPGLVQPIRHGLMEIGYAQHYASQATRSRENLDITFTATTSASGSTLLGSSREFCGFDGQSSPAVMQAILDRAIMFLPGLSQVDLLGVDVRVGLRPYAPRGLPYVGWMLGTQGLLVAAGHEGSGLTYGPATGEIIRRLVMGEKLDQELAGAVKVA